MIERSFSSYSWSAELIKDLHNLIREVSPKNVDSVIEACAEANLIIEFIKLLNEDNLNNNLTLKLGLAKLLLPRFNSKCKVSSVTEINNSITLLLEKLQNACNSIQTKQNLLMP